nr:MAG TPA: hypothetical protein [Caudoviricetes sp.]
MDTLQQIILIIFGEVLLRPSNLNITKIINNNVVVIIIVLSVVLSYTQVMFRFEG